MKPSEDVARLAAQMRELSAGYRTLPILVGDLCAERAGVPKPAEIGRAALGSLFEQTPEYAAQLLPAGPGASDDEIEAAFLRWLGGMTHLQRFRVLEPFYRRVPVPLFYQDLAGLVVHGFVAHILTTNVDTLLEQALDAVGLAAGSDYAVHVVRPHDDSVTSGGDPPTSGGDDPPTTIVKLYGDLRQEQIPVQQEIDQILHESRFFVEGELATDLVVVGHQIDRSESRSIDRWLARGGGEVWWVHPEEPAQDLIAPIRASRNVTLITGHEQGEPEAFFGQLNLHLIRLPALRVLSSAETSPGDDLEHEYLKSRIENAQVSRYALEQNVVPGVEDIAVQAQIGYLSDTVASYGSQLRDLNVPAADDLRSVLTRLVEEAERANVDQSTIDFLAQQATVVERELAAPEPNRLLVSGAVSAASSVSQGLGSQLSSEIGDELRSAAATYSVAQA